MADVQIKRDRARKQFWPCKTPFGWMLGERNIDEPVYFATESEATETAERLNREEFDRG